MKTCKISSITVEEVVDFPVYNWELKSLEEADDLYFCDIESQVITHNCVRKDPLMINEFFPQADFALQAYKVHEYMPKFMTQLAGDLEGKNVIVLGYTFKRNTDDTRDSLVPKLIRYIEKQVPKKVAVIEPHLPVGFYDDRKWNDMYVENCSLNSRLIKYMTEEKYTIIVGTPHSEFLKPEYQELMKNAEKVVDVTGLIWKN